MNNVVDTSLWKQNLRGDTFYRTAGDRIIPCVYSPMINVGAETATTVTVQVTNSFGSSQRLQAMMRTVGAKSSDFGEAVRIRV